jgi:hypothetical protein
MILFLAEPFGVNPDRDLEAAPIQKQELEESPTLTIPPINTESSFRLISA